VTAEEVAREWEVPLGERLLAGRFSFVAFAGDDAVLKVVPVEDDEADHEADALALLAGDGAVRLLRHDRARRAILIERALPGHDASRLPEPEAIRVAIAAAKRLWRPAARGSPFRWIGDHVARWLDNAGDHYLVREAKQIYATMHPGATGAPAGARQHEEHVGEPVQPGQEILARDVARVDAFDDMPLRSPSDRSRLVEACGEAVLAWDDEASCDGGPFLEQLKHLIESCDRRPVEALLQPTKIVARGGDLRHDQVQAALELEKLASEARSGGERSRDADHGLCLVEVAERLDPRIGLANALFAEQRGLAAVAGAGGDARGPPTGAGGHADSLAALVTLCSISPAKLPAGFMEGPMPSGRGDTKKKNEKKKSKEQLERELKKKGVAQPVQPMTFEIVKPKRKEKETW